MWIGVIGKNRLAAGVAGFLILAACAPTASMAAPTAALQAAVGENATQVAAEGNPGEQISPGETLVTFQGDGFTIALPSSFEKGGTEIQLGVSKINTLEESTIASVDKDQGDDVASATLKELADREAGFFMDTPGYSVIARDNFDRSNFDMIKLTIHIDVSVSGIDGGCILYEYLMKDQDAQWKISFVTPASFAPIWMDLFDQSAASFQLGQ